MTVTYKGGDNYEVQFYDKVVELTGTEILEVQNYNFETQKFTESVAELEDIIEDLTYKLNEINEFRTRDVEEITSLLEQIADLEAKGSHN